MTYEFQLPPELHQSIPVKCETYKRTKPRLERNGPCPCLSGKKYKKCCLIEPAGFKHIEKKLLLALRDLIDVNGRCIENLEEAERDLQQRHQERGTILEYSFHDHIEHAKDIDYGLRFLRRSVFLLQSRAELHSMGEFFEAVREFIKEPDQEEIREIAGQCLAVLEETVGRI